LPVTGDAPDPPRDRSAPSNVTLVRGHALYEALAESGFPNPGLAKVKADVVADILAEVPLFSALAEEDRRAIADAAQVASVSGGQVILREGTNSAAFYVLLTGSVTVHRPGEDTSTLRRGDFFGELGLLEDAPRTASVTADRELWMLRIPRSAFLDIVRREPRIGEMVRRSLGDRSPEAPNA
jgi:signal-transduction protein with cAMP-binding, CBS, and nucleotidyltransferase domain